MALTPTPEQIQAYAATLRGRSEESARRRRERRACAWDAARQAAELLRVQFGATGVRVFGSLVDLDNCPPGLRRAVEQSGMSL